MNAVAVAESGYAPDWLVRFGIRRRIRSGLRRELRSGCEARAAARHRWIEQLKSGPIAIEESKANEQHYEIPAAYFERVLGPNWKYSSGYWPAGVTTLEESERAMLDLSCERAELADGMRILELGCGWGSFCLHIARRYPNATVTAVSNSHSQRRLILERAEREGIDNVEVVTANVVDLRFNQSFDRVVSVEMFEHLRNYRALFERISNSLVADGKLWFHVFVHRDWSYPFEDSDSDDWMSRHFFSGGTMPSVALFSHFQDHLRLDRQWSVNGINYAKTLEAWLARHDSNRREVTSLFRDVYGERDADRWYRRWRIFYQSCAELFAFDGGDEWFVSHYLFSKR